MANKTTNKSWVVIPAAGYGKRLGAEIPKQYVKISGREILSWTLNCFDQYDAIDAIVVAVSQDDQLCDRILESVSKPVYKVTGGEQRFHSVFNALTFLADKAADDDWVLVHDAARPCIAHGDLDKLYHALDDHPVGGLLVAPVTDTIKRLNQNGQYAGTEDRSALCRALTPQMFRYSLLYAAVKSVVDNKQTVTDDAEAIERAGQTPVIVEGRSDNIKITTATDLDLAKQFLEKQRDLEAGQ